LVEIHLHSLFLGANQITIPSEEVLSDAISFLRRINEHRISYTFAPNFFLALLVEKSSAFGSYRKFSISSTVYNRHTNDDVLTELDLSCLRSLISGGEANLVETCEKLTQCLSAFGTSKAFIRPGFGITETCAGAIYNAVDCPEYDVLWKNEFACLGECIPGIQMRISDEGELELWGNIVFRGYYNNDGESHAAFTDDGWFRTGDVGYLDEYDRLHLTGREKELVIVSG
jgi:long-subunit acyl-CoA synthetase (AMP-forming)